MPRSASQLMYQKEDNTNLAKNNSSLISTDMNILEYYRTALELGNSSTILLTLSYSNSSTKAKNELAHLASEFYLCCIDALKLVSTATTKTKDDKNSFKLGMLFVVPSESCQVLLHKHKSAVELVAALCPASASVITPHNVELSTSYVTVQNMQNFFFGKFQSTLELLLSSTQNTSSRNCPCLQPPVSILDAPELFGEFEHEIEIVSAIFLYNLGLAYLLRIPSPSTQTMSSSCSNSSVKFSKHLLKTCIQVLRLSLQIVDELVEHYLSNSSSSSWLSMFNGNNTNYNHNQHDLDQVCSLEYDGNEDLSFHVRTSQFLTISKLRCYILANVYEALYSFSHYIGDTINVSDNDEAGNASQTAINSRDLLELKHIANAYYDCIYRTFEYVHELFQNPTFVIAAYYSERVSLHYRNHHSYETLAPAA